MELHQLRYIIHVAKHLNFSKAANELCVTQPTLSHQILKLEDEIGVSLFERNTRSVKLTLAGEKFVASTGKILAELESLRNEMQEYKALGIGDIRIGTLPVTDQRLISYISIFQKSYPNIHMQIMENSGSHELIKLLLAGNIDVAYVIPESNKMMETQVNFYPLTKGKVVLITSKNHRFAHQKQISLSSVAEEPFILPPRTHSMYNVILNACHASGFKPKIACECGQMNTLFNLIAKGLGISFISSQFAESSLPSDIIVIQFKPNIEREICLAALKSKYQMPVVSIFCNFMLKAFNSSDNL
jgi:LysR family transcriptional regulator, transcription activator of glutamate synthase operon